MDGIALGQVTPAHRHNRDVCRIHVAGLLGAIIATWAYLLLLFHRRVLNPYLDRLQNPPSSGGHYAAPLPVLSDSSSRLASSSPWQSLVIPSIAIAALVFIALRLKSIFCGLFSRASSIGTCVVILSRTQSSVVVVTTMMLQ